MGEAAASALAASGTKRVVFLSSLGADQPSGTGPIVGLHVQEKRLKAVGWVGELDHRQAGKLVHQGITGGAIRGDLGRRSLLRPIAMFEVRG